MKNIYLWIIPHKKNKYHPRILQPIGLSVFLLIYLLLPPIYNATEAGKGQVLGYATNINVSDLHSISNQQRSNNGVAQLSLNNQLNSAASAKASDMIAKNYWAHVAPDGTTPWAFINGSGYVYATAAENLAKGFNTSSGVVTGWMNSAGHRTNMLNSTYVDVGYGIANGVLLGEETTVVVAMYASRNVPAPAPTPTPAPPSAPTPTPTPVTKNTTPTTKEPTTSTPTASTQPNSEQTTPEQAEPPKSETKAPAQPAIQQQSPIQASSNNQPDDSFASVAGAFTTAPLNTYKSFNWSQKVSIVLICTLILLYLLKHTLIWRQRKKGVRGVLLRSHPLGQAFMLLAVLILTIVSSAGAVL